MRIAAGLALDEADVVALYDAVGWTAYTSDPAQLLRALAASHTVLAARADDGTLIGLARTLSDGEVTCFVQDLLVHPAHQRAGVGRALMDELRRRYAHCRRFVLLTGAADTADGQLSHPFYRSAGLVPVAADGLEAFTVPAGATLRKPDC